MWNGRQVTKNDADIACVDFDEVHEAIKRLNAGDICMYSNHLSANDIFKNIFLIRFQWCHHTDSRQRIWSGLLLP